MACVHSDLLPLSMLSLFHFFTFVCTLLSPPFYVLAVVRVAFLRRLLPPNTQLVLVHYTVLAV